MKKRSKTARKKAKARRQAVPRAEPSRAAAGRRAQAARPSPAPRRVWPWLVVARRWLENLLRPLLRPKHLFALEPLHQLLPVQGEPSRWRSTGEDPYFNLRPYRGCFPHGWVLLRFTMRLRTEPRMARLYWDTGGGYREEDAIDVPVTARGVVNHLVELPHGIRALRWDPVRGPGDIGFAGPVTLVEIGRWEKAWRMKHRIRAMLKVGKSGDAALAWARQGGPLARGNYEQAYYAISRARAGGAVPCALAAYRAWIAKYELPAFADLKAIGAEQSRFRLKPLISVLMPVYNTPEGHLRQAIESVLGQSYPRWQLCIADDASTEPHVRKLLERYRRRDPRIKVAYRESNGHISAASNTALALAEGEYVALLDHDDELSPHALHCIVKALDGCPAAKILYSDEDKIDEEGGRRDPHFKPDWNPDLLLAQNYVSHLGVYQTALLREVGGLRQGYEGSQDYDLLLRCVERAGAGEIVHVPKVLYHWRLAPGSTALAATEKSYTSEAGLKALQDHLRRAGLPGRAEPGKVPNTYRVVWQVPAPPPLVSLIIPTRDMLAVLAKCVGSILEKTLYPNYEILIVDNQSVEPKTLAWLKRFEGHAKVRVVRYDRPFNFSAINNFAVRLAKGELIGLVNNDIEVISPGWLDEMVSHACRPEVGCVGAKLYYPNDTVQHGGVVLGLGGIAGHSHLGSERDSPGYFSRLFAAHNVSAVTAACLLVRRGVYEEVGGLDEAHLAVAFNDVDFCLKVREAGYANVWTPYAELYHHESLSRRTEDTPEKKARFAREVRYMEETWSGQIVADPCYNPNLSLDLTRAFLSKE